MYQGSPQAIKALKNKRLNFKTENFISINCYHNSIILSSAGSITLSVLFSIYFKSFQYKLTK